MLDDDSRLSLLLDEFERLRIQRFYVGRKGRVGVLAE